jgi:DNA-binding MarR family transcriptional regulator
MTRDGSLTHSPDTYKAHLQYGYTLKDIAEYIGLHYTTVSRVIKKIEREDEK